MLAYLGYLVGPCIAATKFSRERHASYAATVFTRLSGTTVPYPLHDRHTPNCALHNSRNGSPHSRIGGGSSSNTSTGGSICDALRPLCTTGCVHKCVVLSPHVRQGGFTMQLLLISRVLIIKAKAPSNAGRLMRSSRVANCGRATGLCRAMMFSANVGTVCSVCHTDASCTRAPMYCASIVCTQYCSLVFR